MRQEVRDLMADTHTIEFRATGDLSPVSGQLVVVELKGVCDGPIDPAAAIHNGDDLATTSVVDGHVQPFSKVNCGAVSALLGPGLSATPSAKRRVLIGRSLGRIVAHELYHILADETRHAHAGVAKPSFSTAELLSTNFTFEESARERMTDRPAYVPGAGFAGDSVLQDSDER